jgi:hypothetical protein
MSNSIQNNLKESNQPIGVATYQTTKKLPSNLEKYLPTTDEIEKNLIKFMEGINER